jgi:putative hydrolase of the HAD superfamily
MRFDAVAFDLDGTLYPTHRLYAIAWTRMLPLARALAAFSAARMRMRALGSDPAHRRAPPADGVAFRALQADLVARRLGMGTADAAAMIERDFYRGPEELFSRVRPFSGLVPALDALAASGLRVALLSDLPPLRKLELLGLAGRFEPALCSEDSGFLKPAVEPFAMLASRMGLQPGRILYVGNNPWIDVAGAKAAGMPSAIVTRRRVAEADLAFSDWRELVAFALG